MKKVLGYAVATIASVIFLSAVPVKADTITLSSTNRAWVNEQGINVFAGNSAGNYLAGFTSGMEYRSYFVFDLASVSENIVAAEFRFTLRNSSGTTDLEFFDYTGDLFDLEIQRFDPSPGGLAIFNDLGSGVSYWQGTIPGNQDLAFVASVFLEIPGIDALNNARAGQFAMGATVLNLPFGQIGNSSAGSSHITELVLTTGEATSVPEPTTIALLGIGLVGLAGGAVRRRRKRRVKP